MTTQTLPTVADYYTDPYPERKGDERIYETCGKCCGTGSVSWGIDVDGVVDNRIVPKVCFDCGGTGTYSFKVSSARDKARRHAKQRVEVERKAAEHTAKIQAARAEFTAKHPDVVEALNTISGEFGLSLREQYEANGTLTDKQADAVRRIAGQQDESAPVVEGRIVITGKVLTSKWQDSMYGETFKMLVLDDRGFKVWGTVPQTLMPTNYFDEHGEYQHEHGVGCGGPDSNHEVDEVRVTFTATVERSNNDEAFGFYKRPTKAEVV